jgi:hypothetical protein
MASEKKQRWKRVKMEQGGGVHIDVKKRTIMYNPKDTWIRFETGDIIHIYGVATKQQT